MPPNSDNIHMDGFSEIHQDNTLNVKNRLPRASVSITVAKAINILEILALKADGGVSLSELCSYIDLPKSSTHRYLVTLQELDLAERKSNDRYYLGTKVVELAGAYLLKSDLRNDSQAALDELSEISGETVHLAVPSGTEVIYIAKVESKHALSMFSHIGARLPMHCTALGKAILAFSDSNDIHAVLKMPLLARTPNTITSTEALENELALIRSRGFAFDNEENEIGIRCVAAPIFDYSSKPIGAISISAPSDRMDQERCNCLGPIVFQATQKISKRKGFSGLKLVP